MDNNIKSILKKSLLNKAIIILTFALLIFHTLTFMQLYYNFFITMALFVVIVILSLIDSKWTIKIDNTKLYIFFFFLITTTIIIFLGLVLKDKKIAEMLRHIHLIIWPCLYYILKPRLDKNMRQIFIWGFILFFVISLTASLIALINNPEASRELAGHATPEESNQYYAQGIGGYGFIYGTVFVVFGLLFFAKDNKNKIIKISIVALTILALITILYASYTTALLMFLAMLWLFLFSRAKTKKGMWILLGVLLLILIFMNSILGLIQSIAQELNLEWIVDRLGKILSTEGSGELSELSRFEKYMQSWSEFVSNPFIGGINVGSHSFILDTLGTYGLFGICYLACFAGFIFNMIKDLGWKRNLIYILIIVLLLINTLDPIVFAPMVFFVLPILLNYKEKELSEIQDEKRKRVFNSFLKRRAINEDSLDS